jgi:type I restriction enzyme S subunit
MSNNQSTVAVNSETTNDGAIPKGYKQTSFGVIPKNWELRKLKTLLTIGSGKDYKHLERGKIPVYGSGGVMTYVNKWLYNGKSVCIGRKGTIDKPIFLNEKFWTVDTLYFTYDFVDSLPEYVFYGFQAINWYRHNEASGVPSLSKSTVYSIKIPLPPLPEQQKIASILGTWDEAIQKCEQTIAALKTRNKGLAQQLLTPPDAGQGGKKRLKGFEGEWEELPLSHFFTERNERGVEGLPLLSIGESGVYPQDTGNKKDTSNKDKSKYKRICPNDIGYNTMRMWQGRSALSAMEGIISPAYTIVKSKVNAHPEFFARLFKTSEMVHRFFRNSQGLVSDTLNCKFKDFKIVKAFVPVDFKEQQAIAKVLNEADRELQLYQQKLTTLKDQKKGLMQKLLTGEVRVNVENH